MRVRLRVGAMNAQGRARGGIERMILGQNGKGGSQSDDAAVGGEHACIPRAALHKGGE